MTHDNVLLCDTKGVVYQGRTEGMNQWKSGHAVATRARTLTEALEGADAFFGLSVKGALTQPMVRGMAERPIIFAMANPDPEITPEEARAASPRRDHRHRPQRLPESGQQRARLPLHLSRCARRARAHHQRGDEDRRRGSARAIGARGRARRGQHRRRRAAPAVRPRIHHSQRLRSAPDFSSSAGSRQSGDGQRRGATPDRRSAQIRPRIVGPTRSDRERARRDHGKRSRRTRRRSSLPRAKRKRSCARRWRSATPATARRC